MPFKQKADKDELEALEKGVLFLENKLICYN